MPRIVVLVLIGFFTVAPFLLSPAYACGPDSDCMIGERTFRIRMPEGHDGKTRVGAIIFNHGYRGTAAGLMRNKKLGKIISNMGLAFVAPKSARQDWDIPNAPSPGPRVELPFFDKLRDRLINDHQIDSNKIVVSGFSAGGMMTWNLACERGNDYAAFIPIAGTFWAPVPGACPTMPTNIIHIHGTSDKIVPMKGRPIGPTKQGDVYKALAVASRTGGFGKWNSQGAEDGLTCQQKASSDGKILRLCLHPGGHSFQSKWLRSSWETLKVTGAFQ